MRKTTRRVLSTAARDLTAADPDPSELCQGIDETWAALPRRDQQELELACLVMNSRLTALITGSGRGVWTSRPLEERLGLFARLATSRIPVLRSIATSVHQFATAAVYGNPASHPAIGYDSPLPPEPGSGAPS